MEQRASNPRRRPALPQRAYAECRLLLGNGNEFPGAARTPAEEWLATEVAPPRPLISLHLCHPPARVRSRSASATAETP
jgi:hypothetical protein